MTVGGNTGLALKLTMIHLVAFGWLFDVATGIFGYGDGLAAMAAKTAKSKSQVLYFILTMI